MLQAFHAVIRKDVDENLTLHLEWNDTAGNFHLWWIVLSSLISANIVSVALQLQIRCHPIPAPLAFMLSLNPRLFSSSLFLLEFFHGNELLVCFIKTSLRNVFTGSQRFASQILQSRRPARSALRNHVVLYIFFITSVWLPAARSI